MFADIWLIRQNSDTFARHNPYTSVVVGGAVWPSEGPTGSQGLADQGVEQRGSDDGRGEAVVARPNPGVLEGASRGDAEAEGGPLAQGPVDAAPIGDLGLVARHRASVEMVLRQDIGVVPQCGASRGSGGAAGSGHLPFGCRHQARRERAGACGVQRHA